MTSKEEARLDAARKVGGHNPDEKPQETDEQKKARELRESPEGKEAQRVASLPPVGQADIMRQADRETIALREQKANDQKDEPAKEEPEKEPKKSGDGLIHRFGRKMKDATKAGVFLAATAVSLMTATASPETMDPSIPGNTQKTEVEASATSDRQPGGQVRQERQRVETKTEAGRPSQTEHVYKDRRWPVERAEQRENRWFFHDKEIHRRQDYDHNDRHFRIGSHDRSWYYSRYRNVILIDGCWYYEDGGMFWPAYGFDPSCQYPSTSIVFSVGG